MNSSHQSSQSSQHTQHTQPSQQHWANQNERGNRFFLAVTTALVRYLPAWCLKPCIFFVVMYFYATSSAPRQHIRAYQKRLKTVFPETVLPNYAPVFQQFLMFGEAICDRFAVWQRKIRYENLVVEDPDNIYADIRNRAQRGHILVCSHLGNIEICRALVSHHLDFKLNVLVHNQHAQAFNEALHKAGADRIQLIQVADLDANKMLQLQQRIDDGEWLAIAADRVPIHGEKTVEVNFLGEVAELPQGAWLLAGLLKTPVHLIFCVKQNGRYHLKLKRFLNEIQWKRHQREQAIADIAQQFADVLAQECARVPLQWFNFYRFWKEKA